MRLKKEQVRNIEQIKTNGSFNITLCIIYSIFKMNVAKALLGVVSLKVRLCIKTN